MKKLFKIIGFMIALFLIIVIAGLILIKTLINPNDLKPLLQQQIYKMTGKSVQFQGDIHWTLFPVFGFEVNDITCDSPDTFNKIPLLQIKKANLSIRLLPLLRHHIHTKNLLIEGATFNLIKNKQGVTNWGNDTTQQPVTAFPQNIPASSSQEITIAPTTSKPIQFTFYVPQAEITNATLNWEDQQSGKKLTIQQFNLEANHIQNNKPFPIDLDGNFQLNQPQLSGHMELNAQVQLTSEKQLILNGLKINANLQGKALPGQKLTAQLESDLKIDPDTIVANPLKIRLNRSTIISHVTITGLSKLSAQDQTWPTRLKPINLQGDISMDQVPLTKLQVKQVAAKLNLNNGILSITPITAKLYRGNINGILTANMQNKVPNFNYQGNITNVDIAALQNDLLRKNYISGAMTLNIKLSSAGLDTTALTRNLNGNFSAKIQNGAIQGLDIAHVLNVARTVIKAQLYKLPMLPPNTSHTSFSSLSGFFSIRNGLASNNDFKLLNPQYQLTGSGTINLINQRVNYYCKLASVGEKAGHGVLIPFNITGTLTHINTPQVDLKALAAFQLQQELIKQGTRLKDIIQLPLKGADQLFK